MNKITTIGLDSAKNIFHLVGCDSRGKVLSRKKLKRAAVKTYFANLPQCLIGIEACTGSHYWARELSALGHEIKLIPPQHVKAYLRGNKNDYNDALAIAEAVVRPEMRFVAMKTIDQQDQQLLNLQRQRLISDRTAQVNRIRAMLAELGIVLPKGIAALRRHLPALLANQDGRLSALFLSLLHQASKHLQQLDGHITGCDQQLNEIIKQTPDCQRLQSIPGFGPIGASLFYSQVGKGHAYRRGRDVAASLGLVPRQHSSGGKEVLLGISKRGNKTLRCLLVHGARAVVSRVGDKHDPLSLWIKRLIARVGIHKATVAYANKMARMGWAILRYETVYECRSLTTINP